MSHSFATSQLLQVPKPHSPKLFSNGTSRKNVMLKSHGRPPWYGVDGVRISDAYVVAVAGGSASGKTHVARQIVRSLGNIPTVIILSQDSFYKEHDEEELKLAHANMFDFDHPDALDMKLYGKCLQELKEGKQANIPLYSFSEHQRLEETKYMYGAAVIIAEGILALHDCDLRNLYDLKVFVQCDSDLMLARRIKRDVNERGRSVNGILDQYLRYVKPAFDNFVAPSSRHADIIVPGSDNGVAIELISTHIKRQLAERSNQFRKDIAIPSGISTPVGRLNLCILPQTPQLKGILTIIRSKDSERQNFIFFVDRLATLLVENALEHLPHVPKTVITPVGVESHGQQVAVTYLCGVSILRSGGALERGFRRVLNDVPVGSLLVQSASEMGEPLLLHVMLPVCIRQRETAADTWVLVLDAQIGTGAAAFMALRVLLDHGVKEEHIIFVAFLVARGGGISALRRAFPSVKIVCAALDDNMQEGWLKGYGVDDGVGEGEEEVYEGEGFGKKVWAMQPGMGQMGDRYYL